MNTTLALLVLGSFDLFVPSLKQEYFFTKSDRALELDQKVRVQEFGPLGRVLSPDAVATYNGNFNTISLNKANLNGNIIRPAQEIMGPLGDYSKLGTIFHEMGHAEMDVFIENEVADRDTVVKYHYDHKLKDFYKKYFPGFNPHTVFHEHFGYYRAELMEFLSGKMNDVLMYNGYNKFKKSCFLTPPLKKLLAENVTLEEFQKVIPSGEIELYRTQINPRYIFVKGKDLDLASVPQDMIRQTHDLFWAYHQDFYGFPVSQKDLVERMNARALFKNDLANCRAKLYLQAPN
ncbi:MAG: hypothetical protein ACJ76H_15400 [Bacteriovoracaceae bacterium]